MVAFLKKLSFFKQNNRVILVIVIGFVLYIYNQKIYRPRVYSRSESNEYLIFILGVLPNFLGAIITFSTFFLLFKIIFNKKSYLKNIIQAAIYTTCLVVFMELERLINSGIKFDFFDIIASLFGITFCLMLFKKENRKHS